MSSDGQTENEIPVNFDEQTIIRESETASCLLPFVATGIMSNNEIDDDEDDIYLSEHSQSMRRACDYCLELFRQLEEGTNANANANRIKLLEILRNGEPVSDRLKRMSREHKTRRKKAYDAFWASQTRPVEIETLHVETVDGNCGIQEVSPDQVRSFKDRFQNKNVPCLIAGLDRSPHFRFINEQWRNQSQRDDSSESSSKINREWFRKALGNECLVPLRYVPLSREGKDHGSDLSLDEDGRAMECETKEVKVKEWIEMLEASRKETDGMKEEEPHRTIYYLKDWHLQQGYPAESDSCDERNNATCSLYTVPKFFGHDLLNSFLTRFTKGDYRFCYWGPSRSFTARHSDVMHSFSWSYNVVGTKEWTFYRSDIDRIDNDNAEEYSTFSVIQKTGQTIFVPAKWQHKVVNLEETISINHNWITSANIDLVWDCLKVEMAAIQNELQGWGGDDLEQNLEACENMLRGCIGLDVTGFVLMALVGLLEAITTLLSMPLQRTELTEAGATFSTRQEELMFETIRLSSVLQELSRTERKLLRLQSRMSAVLQSDEMAQRIENMLQNLVDWTGIS